MARVRCHRCVKLHDLILEDRSRQRFLCGVLRPGAHNVPDILNAAIAPINPRGVCRTGFLRRTHTRSPRITYVGRKGNALGQIDVAGVGSARSVENTAPILGGLQDVIQHWVVECPVGDTSEVRWVTRLSR